MRVWFPGSVLCALLSVSAGAQGYPDPAIASTIDRLFAAMRKSDTAAVRAAFLAGGRVIVMPGPEANSSSVRALSLDYDIYRAGALTQCGSNPVQLQKSDGVWKIVSMAFSSRTTGCPSHPPPNRVARGPVSSCRRASR